MMSTFEDVTTILEKKGLDDIEPKICFDPARKTFKKAIQTINVIKTMVGSYKESNIANYYEDRFTAFQSLLTIDAAIEASRTLPVQLNSPWGNELPNFSMYSDSDFVDDYEVLEDISQKATQRKGW